MKKLTLWLSAIIVFGFGVIQLIPVDRSNPPVETDLPASPVVKAILKRVCYDCHSNETVWPWYSQMAPFSWLLAWDVQEGREELNFSRWNRYSPKERTKKVKEIWEEIEEGEMPPWLYLPLHPEARLSAEERAVVQEWARGGSRLADDDDN